MHLKITVTYYSNRKDNTTQYLLTLLMSKGLVCYTIGYGDRALEEFISILHESNITHLIDIRRYPHSWMEEYDKESLQVILPKNGIAYVHCAGVGGMRESSYNEYMGTEEFRSSFSKLVEFIMVANENNGNPVLMCAEKNPKNCHRRYLAQQLELVGVKIVHLTEAGQMDLCSFY